MDLLLISVFPGLNPLPGTQKDFNISGRKEGIEEGRKENGKERRSKEGSLCDFPNTVTCWLDRSNRFIG